MTRLAALEYGSLRLDDHGQNVWVLLLQEASDPGEGATRAHSTGKGIYAAFHLLPKFASRRVVVKIRISGIIELQSRKGSWRFGCHFPAAPDSALHGLCFRSADHGRAKASHQDAFFLG